MLIILAAYSCPVQSLTQRRTTEKAPLKKDREKKDRLITTWQENFIDMLIAKFLVHLFFLKRKKVWLCIHLISMLIFKLFLSYCLVNTFTNTPSPCSHPNRCGRQGEGDGEEREKSKFSHKLMIQVATSWNQKDS